MNFGYVTVNGVNSNVIPEGNSSYKQSYNPHNNTVAHWPGRPVLPASRKPPSMRKPVSETCMEHPDKYRPYISYSIPHQSPAYPDKSPEVSSQIPQNTPVTTQKLIGNILEQIQVVVLFVDFHRTVPFVR